MDAVSTVFSRVPIPAMSLRPAEITCADLKARLDAGAGVLLIDCREPHERDLVRIEPSVPIPMSEFVERISRQAGFPFPEIAHRRDEEVVVYCHHGVRSLQVAAWLSQQGFAEARSLRGGIDAWAAEIDPTLPRY